MPKLLATAAILALTTSAASAGPTKSNAEVSIGWDKTPQGQIIPIGDPNDRGVIAPLDQKVFAGSVASKQFVGVQVALKLPKGTYELECQVKHDPKAGEPVDLAFKVHARKMAAGQWGKPFQPELNRFKGPLYTLKTTVKAAGPAVENRFVFAASKTMRFKSCVVVAEGGHNTTSAATKKANR
jgi:hypothetical protein